MKILVAIPAFNESLMIAQVIGGVRKEVPQADILVVDDGSSDETKKAAEASKATVIRHRMNRGLGGAIGTALQWAKQQNYDVLATIDADGQHDPKDIVKAMAPVIKDRADVVIGTRNALLAEMPWDRKLINSAANVITFLLFGIFTQDSQSGFRVFGKRAINQFRLQTDRMEVSSEIFAEINRLKLKFEEVPIKVIYSDYSRAKGQKNSNSFPVLFRLILRMFR